MLPLRSWHERRPVIAEGKDACVCLPCGTKLQRLRFESAFCRQSVALTYSSRGRKKTLAAHGKTLRLAPRPLSRASPRRQQPFLKMRCSLPSVALRKEFEEMAGAPRSGERAAPSPKGPEERRPAMSALKKESGGGALKAFQKRAPHGVDTGY